MLSKTVIAYTLQCWQVNMCDKGERNFADPMVVGGGRGSNRGGKEIALSYFPKSSPPFHK